MKVPTQKVQRLLPIILLVFIVIATVVCIVIANHHQSADYTVNTGVHSTTLSGDGQLINLTDGENLISGSGIYHLTGSAKGFIHINTGDDEVKLILDQVNLTNIAGPAIYIESNGNVYIELTNENTLTSTPTDDFNGAIFSKADLLLTANTNGVLNITSTIDGIVTKDDLEINGGTYIIKADDDGIVGKDSVKITDGTFDLATTGLGIKTSNTEEKGDLEITGGNFKIISTGKGIKAEGSLKITAGTFRITSTDDSLHSNGFIYLAGGDYTISSGDDGIHADTTLTIEDGNINIIKSHEGLESNIMNINGGTISVVADDDGLNTANSSGESQMFRAGDAKMYLSGGAITIDASGDGLDSNGIMTISGGLIYINGPTTSDNAAVDCDGDITITGGTIIAVGAAGMAQNATSAKQPSVLINLTTNYAGAISFGNLSYTPTKAYSSILISSPDLQTGETYNLIIDGTTINSITISDIITTYGSSGMMPGGGAGGGGNPGGGAGGGGNPGGGNPGNERNRRF